MAHAISQVTQVNNKSKTHKVEATSRPGIYIVTSGSSGNEYRVDVNACACTCERQQYIGRQHNDGKNACSHFIAAYRADQAAQGYQAVPRPADQDVTNLRRATSPYGDGIKFTHRKAAPVAPKFRPTSDHSLAELNDMLFA